MSDPRTTLARPELAPIDLEGVARAAAFAKTERRRAGRFVVPVRRDPTHESEQTTQLLFGEAFDVLRRERDFVWGQSRRDGYVGWAEAAALDADVAEPTHWTRDPRAAVLSAPRIRAPLIGVIGLNAPVRQEDEHKSFIKIAGAGWIAARQLSPIGSGFQHPLDLAPAWVGTPYVWGGRDGSGLDCSGLIQQLLFAAGLACPRDADQQGGLGGETPPDRLIGGDLVIWRGHIGMMLDADRLIHANAHHMAVAIEPLAGAIARVAATETGQPTAYRRLDLR